MIQRQYNIYTGENERIIRSLSPIDNHWGLFISYTIMYAFILYNYHFQLQYFFLFYHINEKTCINTQIFAITLFATHNFARRLIQVISICQSNSWHLTFESWQVNKHWRHVHLSFITELHFYNSHSFHIS